MLKGVSQGIIASLLGAIGLNFGNVLVSAQTKPPIKPQTVVPKLSVIYVNPTLGNDLTAKGTLQAPFRTITNALAQAKPATTIKLAAGTYSVASGEIFPIQLKAGVIVEGNEAKQGIDTVILGGGNFLSPTLTAQNIAVLGEDRAELRGVTVTNKNPRGFGLWLENTSPKIISNTFTGSTQDGILVLGKSIALISKNTFITNGANGLSIEGAAPEISSNRFENTGYAIVIRQGAAPKISGNFLNNNRSGVLILSGSSPVLRGNVIERNRQTGVTILANSYPDLGSTTSPGNNVIRFNLQKDITYTGVGAIAAVGNQVLSISGNIQQSGQLTAVQTNPRLNLPTPSLPNSLFNPPRNLSKSNTPIRTLIPNSVVVRSTLPTESVQPLPENTNIDPNLPPIALKPPIGSTINRTITISRAKPTPSAALRYRVVVASNSESSKLEIRRIVPTAFTAKSNGQEVIQVGAFSDRTAADEQVKKLAQAGINAAIEAFTQ
jgi:parallel beta-helix repeat protein